MGLGLHIEIPLLSLQEHGRAISWKYVYNSPTFSTHYYAGSSETGITTGNFAIQAPGSQFKSSAADNWQLVATTNWQFLFDVISQDDAGNPLGCGGDGTTPDTYQAEYIHYVNFRLQDPDGTAHPLAMEAFQYTKTTPSTQEGDGPSVSACPGAFGDSLSSPTLDGSGAYVDLAQNAFWLRDGTKFNLQPQPPVSGIPNGFRYAGYPSVISVEDRNGNYLMPPGGTFLTDALGRGLTVISTDPSSVVYQYTDSNGATQNITVNLTLVPVTTNDCDLTIGGTSSCVEYVDDSTGGFRLPKSIVLPGGATYTFTYNSPGTHAELSKIVLPTGAEVDYTYQRTYSRKATPRDGTITFRYAVSTRTEHVNGVAGTWSYIIPDSMVGDSTFGTTVKDPLENCTEHDYAALTSGDPLLEQSVTYKQGCGATAQVLKTINRHYVGDNEGSFGVTFWNPRPDSVTTTIANGQSSHVETDYDSYIWNTRTLSRVNPIEVREFDFSQSVPTRITHYQYLNEAGSSAHTASDYASRNILDRVKTITVSNPAGPLLTTAYDYDAASSPVSSSGAIGRDSAYGSWGNATSKTVTDNIGGSTNSWGYKYEDTGNLKQSTDALGHATTYLWDDNWANASCGLPNGQQSHIYVKQVTNPLNQSTTYSYNSCSGSLASIEDINLKTTSMKYDLLGRTKSIDYPDEGKTSFDYVDVSPFSVKASQFLTSTVSKDVTTFYDDLGRVSQTQLKTDNPPGTINVDTYYDQVGNVSGTSNPYFTKDDLTYGVTRYVYDALGRKTIQTQPDSNTIQWCYDNIATASQANCTISKSSRTTGTWIDATDENGRHSQRTYDALGRLTAVMEPDPDTNSLALETDYAYNVFDNLEDVYEIGKTGYDTQQNRSFTYDSLSRLLTAVNPESGSITYGYANGTSLCSGDITVPCSKTDARGVTTQYGYDTLNRLISRQYTGEANPTLSTCFEYGTSSASGANTIGRIVSEWTQPGACSTSMSTSETVVSYKTVTYDPMGRTAIEQQCVLAPCATPSLMQYSYDLAGNVTYSTNGLSASQSPQIGLTTGYDAASRLAKVTSSWNDSTHPSVLFEADKVVNNVPPYGPFGLGVAQISVTSTGQQNMGLSKTYDIRGRTIGIAATVQQAIATLPPGTPTITSVLNNIVLGTSPTVSVEDICNSACGSIQFNVFGSMSDSGAAVLGANGSGSFQISPSLAVGQYTLTVSFHGNAQYSAASTSIIFSVVTNGPPPTSLSASLSATLVVQGATPILTTVLGCSSACGTLSYILDGQPLQTSAVNADGTVAPVSLSSGLTIGQHTVVISYSGNAVQASATTSVAFTVVSNIPTVTVNLDVNPVPAGETPRILTNVNCNACGTINYALDGSVFQQSSIGSDGSAIATLTPQLSNGSHLLTVSYQGNGAYQPSSASLTFQVVPNTLPVPPIVASLQLNPVAVGTSPPIIAVLGCSNACGYVTYALDGQVFQSFPVNSDGTLPSPLINPNIAVGAHTITVNYGGNAQFAPASTSVPFNVVSAISMTITANLDVNPVPAGETPLIRTQVGCTIPCGYMNFAVDGNVFQGSSINPDGSGGGNPLYPIPPMGRHIFTATNLGDATHAAVSTSFAFEVIPNLLPVLSLAIALPADPMTYGTTPGVITILGASAISPAPTGYVSWFVDGQKFQQYGMINGVIAAPPLYSGIPIGAHTLTAQYGGDANYAPSTTTIPFAVVSAPSMTVTASFDVNPVPSDETPLMHTQVSCNASCGYMNFAVDGSVFQGSSINPDGSGGGNALNPIPSVGWHIFTATNLGDATHAPASTSFAFQVIPDTLPVLSLVTSLPINPMIYGSTPTLSFVLGSSSSFPTGHMSFYVDGNLFQKWGIIIGNTVGPPLYPGIPIGSHVLTVRYEGDANYAPATALYPFTVVANQ